MYLLAGGPCSWCASGRYKNFTGAGLCTVCPSNGIGPAGSALRTNCQCPKGWVFAVLLPWLNSYVSQVHRVEWSNLHWYFLLFWPCSVWPCLRLSHPSRCVAFSSACVSGKYKTSPGSALCTSCISGQTTNVGSFQVRSAALL